MAVAYGSAVKATADFGGGSGNVSVGVPTGLTTDNTWILWGIDDNNGGDGLISTPSGFTDIAPGQRTSGGFPYAKGFWKTAGASESAVTVAFGSGSYGSCVHSVRMTGADTTNPIGNVGTAVAASGTSIDAPDITIQNNDAAAILFCGLYQNSTSNVPTKPASATSIQTDANGGYQHSGIAYELRPTAGSYAPSTWSFTSGSNIVAATVELKAAGSGGGSTQVATGFDPPSTNTVVAGTWTTPGNVYATDGVTASSTPAKNGSSSLDVGGFGFSIPAGATIDKVEIQVVWRASTASSVATLSAAANVGGTIVGTNNDTAEPTVLTTRTYDITAARAWAAADFNDGTFFVRLTGARGNTNTTFVAHFDSVAVQITYTPGSIVDVTGTLSVTGTFADTVSGSGTVEVVGGGGGGTPYAWDPTVKTDDITLSNSDRTATVTTDASDFFKSTRSVDPVTGLQYFELTATGFADASIYGVGLTNETGTGGSNFAGSEGFMYRASGDVESDFGTVTTLSPYGTGATVCVAINRTTNRIWFDVGEAPDTSVPGLDFSGIVTANNEVYLAIAMRGVGDAVALNSGETALVGTVPAGFTAPGASASPPEITGTLAIADSFTDSVSGTGALGITGTVAATDSSASTIAGSGSVGLSGSIAVTDNLVASIAGSGSVAITGSASVADGLVGSIAGAGSVAVTGSAAITDAAIATISGSGSTAISGSAAVADSFAATVAGSGSVAITGSGSITDSFADTVAGSGSIGAEPITGTLAPVDSFADTVAGTGTVGTTGTLATSFANTDAVSGAGSIAITGSLAATDPVDTISIAGNVAITGTGAISGPGSDNVSGAASIAVVGTFAAVDGGTGSPTATGLVNLTGSFSTNDAFSDTVTGSGSVVDPSAGFVAIVETFADNVTGAGSVAIAGTGTLAYATTDAIVGTATVNITGSLARTDTLADSVAGSATISVTGSLAHAGTFADSVTGSGTSIDVADGALAIVEPFGDTIAGAGSIAIAGSFAFVDRNDTVSGSGSVAAPVDGTLTVIDLSIPIITGAGSIVVTAVGFIVDSFDDLVSGSGYMTPVTEGSFGEPNVRLRGRFDRDVLLKGRFESIAALRGQAESAIAIRGTFNSDVALDGDVAPSVLLHGEV